MISVDIGAPDPTMCEQFDALAKRAAPNVFMHPAALGAVATAGFAQIHVLQAWAGDGAARKLVGFWALRERRIAPFWPRFLTSPPYDYAFVSSPVIDPDVADAVMPAFLDAIANERKLPKVIKLKLLDADAATYRPMMAALTARRARVLKLAESARPFLSGESDRKRSGSTAKKLRQDWNRLSALGAADVANDRTPAGACAAFEIFLDLELRSWKGASGTALLSHDEDAEFVRLFIANLSQRGCASVALLRVDGRPVAAQVLLYSGAMAYTWKTAFDAEFAKFSPGALLIDKVTDSLFAGGIAQFESCATEDSFMAQLWTGRRMTVDLLADVGSERSVNFAIAVFGERAYAYLRELRDRLRAAHWLPAPRRKNLAVTRG
jgi:CelD/BcsL family acetyltransferase involved in cellulose biosynthesis